MLLSTYAVPRRLRTTTLGAVAAAALALGLAGCGGSSSTADGTAGASPSTSSPSASASSDASSSASSGASASATSTAIPTPKVVDGSIEATDQSFSLKLPDGWTSPKRGVPAPFVLGVQDQQDPTNQIAVSSFSSTADATEAANQTAATLRAQKATCDTTEIDGRSVIDCHYAYQGQQVHKMLFPFIHDDKSALMLFQALADSRADAYRELAPILATWRWADGSRLARS